MFALCAPGMEPFTAEELCRLGLLPVPQKKPKNSDERSHADYDVGGIEFSGDLKALYRANLWLRTAGRVLVRLGKFKAAAFSELRKKAASQAWERYLKPGQPVTVRVACHKSRLYHSGAVAERLMGAIEDRLGRPVQRKKVTEKTDGIPPQLIMARLVHDCCTISLDTSGELLHRRGYRPAGAKAPLRETLAAGMLMACNWDGISPLLDPFCGSGTIAIEAALLAGGIAPGRSRRFAFMDWPDFDSAGWQALLSESPSKNKTPPPIIASDRDAGAIRLARANAERAGIPDSIDFSARPVSAIEPDGTGWVVTNPPYGLRVGTGKDLRSLYAQFGKVLSEKCPGWQVAILCNNLRLLGQTGLLLDTGLSLVSGGLTLKLGRGRVRDEASSDVRKSRK